MTKPIFALTLHPEWAWAIAHLDKRAENRSPRFAAQIARRVGDGWLAIHAGKSIGGKTSAMGTRIAVIAVLYAAESRGWEQTPADLMTFRRRYDRCHFPLVRGIDEVLLSPETIVTSSIVALVKLGAVLPPGHVAPWKITDSAALVLSDVRVLAEPIACAGRQGLWVPGPAIQERLRAAVGARADVLQELE